MARHELIEDGYKTRFTPYRTTCSIESFDRHGNSMGWPQTVSKEEARRQWKVAVKRGARVLCASEEEVSYEVTYVERHWNVNAACMIPEAWVAVIYDPNESAPLRSPCGRTEDEAHGWVGVHYPHAVSMVEA